MEPTASAASPPPSRGFPDFQHQIEEMVTNGHSNVQIIKALNRLGFHTSEISLKRYLRRSGIRRRRGAPGVNIGGINDQLAEVVNYLFHHTTLNDDAIAARALTDYGLQTTGRQVRTVRTMFGWLRASSGALRAANTAATHAQVAQVIDGPGRTFGKAWLVAYLRQIHGYKARRNDVAAAQQALDPEGVAQRHPGNRRPRLENYVTSEPNFLWCLDGHDKLTQYGIQIYAAIDAYSRKII